MKIKLFIRPLVAFGIVALSIFLSYFLYLRILFPPEVAAVKHFISDMAQVWVYALCHPRNLVLGFISMPLFIGLFCWHYNRKWEIILASYAFICYNPVTICIAHYGRVPDYMEPYFHIMMNLIR